MRGESQLLRHIQLQCEHTQKQMNCLFSPPKGVRHHLLASQHPFTVRLLTHPASIPQSANQIARLRPAPEARRI